MTETGFLVGYLLRAILTLAFLVLAAAAIRYGWDLAGGRRRSQLLFHPGVICRGHPTLRSYRRSEKICAQFPLKP